MSHLRIQPAQRALVTWRSLLLGVLLIPVNVYWLTIVEVKYYSLDGSCLPLFIEPVFTIFIVILFNFVLKATFKKYALTQAELPDMVGISYMGIGAFFTMLMMMMRMRFFW